MWSFFLPSIIYLHKYLLCSHMGNRKEASYPPSPCLFKIRVNTNFISICDLHHQLILNVEKVKSVIFASYLLKAYKSRFTFKSGHHIPLLIYFQDMAFPVDPLPQYRRELRKLHWGYWLFSSIHSCIEMQVLYCRFV